MTGIILFLIAMLFTAVYFLPFIVASYKEKQNLFLIFILNFFLGWSVIGWIILIIWAYTGKSRR